MTVLLTAPVQPFYAFAMFNVSRTVLGVVAVIAIVLLILGIAADFFPGYIAAAILGIYIVVVLVKGRSGAL